jgi:fatty-acyl-CoA synthase
VRLGIPPRARGLARVAIDALASEPSPTVAFRMHHRLRPNREALVDGSLRLTYAELDERIDRVATVLHDSGVRPRDGVLIAVHNRAAIIEVAAAASRVGARAVPFSYRSTERELAYVIEHASIRAAVVERELAPALERAGKGISISIAGEEGADYEAKVASALPFAPGGTLLSKSIPAGETVTYTSGTTGKPKGAVRGYAREMQRSVIEFLAASPLRGEDRHLAVCPLYHSTGAGFAAFTFALGGTVVIARSFDPEEFLRAVERERITTTALVPTMLHRLVELPKQKSDYDLSSLRVVFSGGAPLSGSLAKRFMHRFGRILYNFYGSTETGINTFANPDELLRSPGTIGSVVPGTEIRLLDDDGNEVPEGAVGEVYVKNGMMIAGYHADRASTDRSMRDGFFSVGDLARVDAHGLYHIAGRKRDMIISGGVNVYPVEVENVLATVPGVAEASVVGVPDAEWGERVVAFVVRNDAVEAQEILQRARAELAGPKLPREIRFVDSLPKNPTGKVLKSELAKLER